MTNLSLAHQTTIAGLSRISYFWGFSKGMGAIFGAVYLSPEPLSLDALVETVGITKGAVSTNVRQLERLGLVHKQVRVGERKDYYTAETDFWKVVRGILRERGKSEFDRAIRTVGESLELVESAADLTAEEAEKAVFYRRRLKNLVDFFNTLDNLVATLVALDNLRGGWLEKLTSRE